MGTGTLAGIVTGLDLVPGRPPAGGGRSPASPTTAAYRCGSRLYLFDTGLGTEHREAILRVVEHGAARYPTQEVVLLNSHGYFDQVGNNGILHTIPAIRRRHYVPREGQPSSDLSGLFHDPYERGRSGFATCLRAQMQTTAPAASTDPALLAQLATSLTRLGLAPALGRDLPSSTADALLAEYPPISPSLATMTDYGDLGPAQAIRIGATRWSGWCLTDENGHPEVNVLQSGGQAPGSVVFHLPAARILLLGAETTPVPVRSDIDAARTLETARKARTLIEDGHLQAIGVAHEPALLPGEDAEAELTRLVRLGTGFATAVEDQLARHPAGVRLGEITQHLVADAKRGAAVAALAQLERELRMPVLHRAVFNQCVKHGWREPSQHRNEAAVHRYRCAAAEGVQGVRPPGCRASLATPIESETAQGGPA
jgi:glyoxylase-like metal-dependent hydrolase (beta-lactamase superfamily II)